MVSDSNNYVILIGEKNLSVLHTSDLLPCCTVALFSGCMGGIEYMRGLWLREGQKGKGQGLSRRVYKLS